MTTSLFGTCSAALFTRVSERATLTPQALHGLCDPGFLSIGSAGARVVRSSMRLSLNLEQPADALLVTSHALCRFSLKGGMANVRCET